MTARLSQGPTRLHLAFSIFPTNSKLAQGRGQKDIDVRSSMEAVVGRQARWQCGSLDTVEGFYIGYA
jgi:hypothetical protein